jgi:hypothetical protein
VIPQMEQTALDGDIPSTLNKYTDKEEGGIDEPSLES